MQTLPVFLSEPASDENEVVRRCEGVWAAALVLYLEDARDALHDRRMKYVEDDDPAREEALADMTGSRAILRHLCSHLDLDPDAVADTFARDIEESDRHWVRSARRAPKRYMAPPARVTLPA